MPLNELHIASARPALQPCVPVQFEERFLGWSTKLIKQHRLRIQPLCSSALTLVTELKVSLHIMDIRIAITECFHSQNSLMNTYHYTRLHGSGQEHLLLTNSCVLQYDASSFLKLKWNALQELWLKYNWLHQLTWILISQTEELYPEKSVFKPFTGMFAVQ